MLKYILLGMLNYMPMTGYALKRQLDGSTAYFWHAYHSQIYTTLRKLEEQGLLESELEDGEDHLNRRVYTITETGKAALRGWLDKPLTDLAPAKEPLLVRLFFSGQRDKAAVLDELRLQRTLREQKLALFQQMKTMYDDNPPSEKHAPGEIDLARERVFWMATLRMGEMTMAMYVAWLDETIEKIEGLEG